MPCRSRCEVRVKAAHNTLLTREIMHFRDEVLAGSAVVLHTMARCSADLDANRSARIRMRSMRLSQERRNPQSHSFAGLLAECWICSPTTCFCGIRK
jgi:hypothetical protein